MPTGLHHDQELEQPVPFVEIAAASAFLDCGGSRDGHWAHALQSREGGDFQPTNETSLLPPRILRDMPENNTVGKRSAEERSFCRQRGSEHGACEFVTRSVPSFAAQTILLYV